jgi:ABC-2 type transport system permease protein
VRLAYAEWSRLFARRFTKFMVVVALLILATVAAGVALNSHRHDAAELAAAHQRADQVRAQMADFKTECERAKQNGGTDQAKFPSDCDEVVGTVRDEDFMRHEFDFRQESPLLVRVFGGILALVGFAVGASFVGAEWTSGGMMNLLLWRPRRVPVLLTKLGSLLAGLTAVTVGLAGAFLGMLYGIAQLRGTMGHVTAGSMASLGLDGVRALAVTLAAAAAGFAVASLGRHTAVALGVAVAWGLVAEAGMRIVLGVAHVTRPERYFASTYVTAWLNKGLHLEDYTRCEFGSFGAQPCKPEIWKITMGQSAALAGIALAVLLAGMLISIRRRDVT